MDDNSKMDAGQAILVWSLVCVVFIWVPFFWWIFH